VSGVRFRFQLQLGFRFRLRFWCPVLGCRALAAGFGYGSAPPASGEGGAGGGARRGCFVHLRAPLHTRLPTVSRCSTRVLNLIHGKGYCVLGYIAT